MHAKIFINSQPKHQRKTPKCFPKGTIQVSHSTFMQWNALQLLGKKKYLGHPNVQIWSVLLNGRNKSIGRRFQYANVGETPLEYGHHKRSNMKKLCQEKTPEMCSLSASGDLGK